MCIRDSVGVVLNCGDWFDEAERLMDTCFEAYDMLTLFRAGQDARAVGVSGGMDRSVRAVSQTSLSVPVREGEEAKLVVDLPDTVQAVSYTHLDVYKRQGYGLRPLASGRCPPADHAGCPDSFSCEMPHYFFCMRLLLPCLLYTSRCV